MYERLHKTFGMHENPAHSENPSYPTRAPKCVYMCMKNN